MRPEPQRQRRAIDEMLRLVERFPVTGTRYPLTRTDGLWLDNETYLRKRLIERDDTSPRHGY